MIDIKDLGPESIGKWVNTQNDVFTGTIAPCYLNKQFQTMYEIEATVTTATQDQLGLTANWPLDWLHAAGFRSTERSANLVQPKS